MRDGGGGHLLQIATPAHCPDDGRAAPVGELRGHGPHPAQHPLHQDGQAGDRADGENGPVPGDAVRPLLSGELTEGRLGTVRSA